MKTKEMNIKLETARQQAEYFFNRETNTIPLSLLESSVGECGLFEHILYPSEELLKPDFLCSYGHDEWTDDLEDEFQAYKDDLEWHPMWGWAFGVPEFWENKVDELYNCGIGVISTDDGTFLFIAGAGYDFYDAHWIPMFSKVVPWIEFEE